MRFALLSLVLMLPTLPQAADCTAKSGPTTAALVELYTSEGCDSCPPADRWLSKHAKTAASVPIAFHVDYWDYLGWKDAFAEARYSERQRQFARAAGARAVYTPQVVVAGRDFPGWRDGAAHKSFDAIASRPARAALEIDASTHSAVRVSAALTGGQSAEDLALHVALTQSGLVTHVKAGENRGEILRHDFVVRDMQVDRRWIGAPSPRMDAQVKFAPRPDWKAGDMGVVAFVQNVKTGEVLQALSAPLCLR